MQRRVLPSPFSPALTFMNEDVLRRIRETQECTVLSQEARTWIQTWSEGWFYFPEVKVSQANIRILKKKLEDALKPSGFI